MSKKAATDPVVDEAPGLGDTEALFPPSPDAVPVAANVSMKLPTFWPDAAEVWFAQADAQFAIRNVTISKTKFYNAIAVLPQGSISDPGSDPRSSSQRPLRCPPRTAHHSLHAE